MSTPLLVGLIQSGLMTILKKFSKTGQLLLDLFSDLLNRELTVSSVTSDLLLGR